MSPSPLFRDRQEAGEKLAQAIQFELEQHHSTTCPVVFALPRGGLPVADPVATRLGCPLSIVVAKKITQPENPELAIGAVTADGDVLWSRPVRAAALPYNQANPYPKALEQAQQKALAQFQYFSESCPIVSPAGKIAILVDDGIATGMTMAVAVESLRARQALEIWICAPVAPMELMPTLHEWADHVIILATPHPFFSVSRFYQEFPQVESSIALSYLQHHCHKNSSQD